MARHLEDRVAWSLATGLLVVGSLLIAAYPAARYFARREHADIARAASAIFSTSLADLQPTADRTFEVRVPDDEQWRRVEKKLKSPTFVLMAVSRSKRATGYPLSVEGLRARVWRNGTEVGLTPISAILHSGEGAGFEIAAKRGDRLAISLVGSNGTPADAVVILAPNWDLPWLSSWGESAAAGDIILPLGGLVLATLGVCCFLGALTFALGRPPFNRGSSREVRSGL